MKTTFDRTGEFHEKFGFPRLGDGQHAPRVSREHRCVMLHVARVLESVCEICRSYPDVLAFYRAGFVTEELKELFEALADNDIVQVADALADLDYIVAGTSQAYRLPHDELVTEVHRTNMAKVRGKNKRGSEYDVCKPEGWTPPDLGPILDRHGCRLADDEE